MYISRKSSPEIDSTLLLTLRKPTEITPTILLFEEIISGGKHCTEYICIVPHSLTNYVHKTKSQQNKYISSYTVDL